MCVRVCVFNMDTATHMGVSKEYTVCVCFNTLVSYSYGTMSYSSTQNRPFSINYPHPLYTKIFTL